jgi:hypothetical protein
MPADDRRDPGVERAQLALAAELIEQQVVELLPHLAGCQSRSRRPQVTGLPQPSCAIGSSCQGCRGSCP